MNKNETRLLLKSIIEIVDELLDDLDESDKVHDHDHYHDDRLDHDHDQSDLRPYLIDDQGPKGYVDKFSIICEKLGLDVSHVDRVKYQRNISWIVSNFEKISNPRAYIEKCFNLSRVNSIGFKIENSSGFKSISTIKKIDEEAMPDDVYGAPIDEINKKAYLFNEDVYNSLKDELSSYGDMYDSFEKVMNNSIKRKLTIGLAIKKGLL